ncbi:MAG: cadmium-translocating P-type ATPase [Clostridiales bacterium]|nr:cadmium-translocating P-type ATPase [Clostridiales bacterium]
MKNIIRKEFAIKGLHCANCAAEMESGINKIIGVKKANIDFIGKRLVLEYPNSMDENNIINQTSKIMDNIESGVRIIEMNDYQNIESSEKNEIKIQVITLIVSLLLFAIPYIVMLPNIWRIIFYSGAYVLAGKEVVYRAVKNLFSGRVFDENFLMTIATIGAFAIGEYPEAAAVMIFFNIGELFQDIALDRSRKSIETLMNIRPDYANIMVESQIQQVSPESVSVGDIIIVKPGEKVPLDGTVLKGNTTIDTSALTGESVPKDVKEGDTVLSGTINKSRMISIRVDKEYSESTVTKILDLVENAALKKAPTENFITKFAKIYTPIVVFAALAIIIIPTGIYGVETFSKWFYRALVFLVISCPCALVVSIPLSFFGGIGGASKKGILVKGGNYLEALNNIEAVVFDKTGTLTEGVFKVKEVHAENNYKEEELLQFAALAESYSDHPIALSIKEAYGKSADLSLVSAHEELTGQGIKVNTEIGDVLAGNSKLMDNEGIEYKKVDSIGTIVYIAINDIYAGYIMISDSIKPDSYDLIKGLKTKNINKTIMLTGDNKVVAETISEELGLNKVYYELLPQDKVRILEKIKDEKKGKGNIVFIGDGINDAPVLAMADIGIAMGGLGSDAAIEASDIVLMTDEPSKLIEAIDVAKFTRKVVWQNIAFALGVKGLVLILGVFGFATMWEAVFADVGVALIAVLNATRVIKMK